MQWQVKTVFVSATCSVRPSNHLKYFVIMLHGFPIFYKNFITRLNIDFFNIIFWFAKNRLKHYFNKIF